MGEGEYDLLSWHRPDLSYMFNLASLHQHRAGGFDLSQDTFIVLSAKLSFQSRFWWNTPAVCSHSQCKWRVKASTSWLFLAELKEINMKQYNGNGNISFTTYTLLYIALKYNMYIQLCASSIIYKTKLNLPDATRATVHNPSFQFISGSVEGLTTLRNVCRIQINRG